MADKFDSYREALVVEKRTLWNNLPDIPDEHKKLLTSVFHQHPEKCQHLEYIRVPTGFCRQLTITTEDLLWGESLLK
ncbi:MAG: hypothetical protein MPJ24_10960 [Pirellulaceae bacterium]|nr:hypothetical protein [Pirellulaceae bacterium]